MTVCAVGRTWRTSARRSAERVRYAISPAYPWSSHLRKNASSGYAAADAMPHASNPSSRARVLMSVLSNELSEHVRKNPAVAERDELFRRVDSCGGLELDHLVLLSLRADGERAAGAQSLREAGQLVALAAGESERRRGDARFELQRQHAHVHEVAAVNALEALRDDRLDAEQERSLCRPVARRSRSVLLAGDDEQRDAGLLVVHRRVVDRHHFAARLIRCPAA